MKTEFPLESLANYFDEDTAARGEAYARDGRVHLLTSGLDWAIAQVQGNFTYQVRLKNSGRRLQASCSCPRFADGYPCKHIWAVIVILKEREGVPQDRTAAKHRSAWRTALQLIRIQAMPETPLKIREGRVEYHLDLARARDEGRLFLDLMIRRIKKSGDPGRPGPFSARRHELNQLPDPEDRAILFLLLGASSTYGIDGSPYGRSFRLEPDHARTLLPLMASTGRMMLREGDPESATPCRLDNGPAWTFRCRLKEAENEYELEGGFDRPGEQLPAEGPVLATRDGWLFTREALARVDFGGAWSWALALRHGKVRIPRKEAPAFLSEAYAMPGRMPVELPEAIRPPECRPEPTFHLHVRRPTQSWAADRLWAQATIDYDGAKFGSSDPRDQRLEGGRLVIRNREAESRALSALSEAGLRPAPHVQDADDLEIPAKRFESAVATLIAAGWMVQADGQLYRTAGSFRMSVSSGIDWFDLEGGIQFGDQTASFPEILKAVRHGQSLVRLGDGSFGVLPAEWLQRHGTLLEAGESQDHRIRFRTSQALFLDLLLAEQKEVRVDAPFRRLRERLASFDGIKPIEAPKGFRGTLRPYQKTGLGWLAFLRDMGWGGCLADDMGLGKTIQVLAMLESRRKPGRAPTLIVVPRSLIFNWKNEAARFTPELRVLDHSGIDRAGGPADFGNHDVVLTTYGTLRRDIGWLRDCEFDGVLLDESQAIKNASTASSKSVRLLKAPFRLALSGTPIENHLGELWSLMEFLNPGILGASSAFKRAAREGDQGTDRRDLALALRPFLLRRTKEQVSPDLPRKTEQTITVELDEKERKRYDDLKEYYRRSLLGRKDLNRAKMNVLEALLRLRQAACHPGLIDAQRAADPSTKLETLLERLSEVLESGRKALVFSQFTTLLRIVERPLRDRGIPYDYLDGQTRDREEQVRRFQDSAGGRVFLISLKAGGTGLNLTSAEYVFLLDPWWNPAVEAQAIDRTHRIGQDKPVMACRLVARNTVEEKVLELQKAKRALADAILLEDRSLIKDLTREDLELLLS